MRHIPTALALVALSIGVANAQTAASQYESFVPTTELYTTNGEPPDTALVQRLFTLAFTEPCSAAIDGGFGGPAPLVHDFTYRGSHDAPTDPERKFRLYQFNCSGGAYNLSSVFYGWDELAGLAPLSFASPMVKPEYEDDGADGKLVSLKLTGMGASVLMTNVVVDGKTGAITGTAYWRGIGDASSSGTWALDDGQYRLVTYEVDASYDGEINPVRVYDVSEPQDVALPE